MKVKVKLTSNESIFRTPEMLLSAMAKFRYIEFTNLMSPLEVFLTLQGSCHDQVMFEYSELEEMHLNPQAKFIMTVDENGQGLETHSFIIYNKDSKWYWFENAWEDMRGIHEFNDYESLIAEVKNNFHLRGTYDKMYLSDFIPSEHTIGEPLEVLVDICMTSANLISY